LDIAQMDSLVVKYREARVKYEEAKKAAAELYHEYEKLENQVLKALEVSGKSKYFVDGVGTVSTTIKHSFKVPSDPAEKVRLFEYIEKTHGKDVLIGYLGIHSASLNSFANREMEGRPDFTIPGLGTPNTTTELRFRKD